MMTGPQIDLTPFCSTNENRPYLHAPWSFGDWTYATNGHIMVRVPRRADVPENSVAPGKKAEQLFSDNPGQGVEPQPIPMFDFPAGLGERCSACAGRGCPAHDCPDCEHVCESCAGSGQACGMVSANIGDADFDARYLRLLSDLPDARVPVSPRPGDIPMPCVFTGGETLLMPLKGRAETHIEPIP